MELDRLRAAVRAHPRRAALVTVAVCCLVALGWWQAGIAADAPEQTVTDNDRPVSNDTFRTPTPTPGLTVTASDRSQVLPAAPHAPAPATAPPQAAADAPTAAPVTTTASLDRL